MFYDININNLYKVINTNMNFHLLYLLRIIFYKKDYLIKA